jgi:2-alkyl-3-oxoalkanoate reductase
MIVFILDEEETRGNKMKILIAGASGAIGYPLIDLLIRDGHEVYGITQSKDKALVIAGKGAKPLILNVLDKDAVDASLASIKPDVVVDMLTHLPKEYTAESMKNSTEMDAKIRREVGTNLQSAAEAKGAKRYIVQSSAFWYEPGLGYANENTPLTTKAPPGIASSARLYNEIEQRVLESNLLEGVALRFGFFYGPGTWFNPDGDVARQIRNREFPIIGKGEGVWNFVHIEDAAKAVASAIYCTPGIYNIVNDHPTPMHEWLPAFAYFLGAKQPLRLTEEEGLKERGAEAVYYATKLRAASNGKAKQSFHFQPRTFEWLLT